MKITIFAICATALVANTASAQMPGVDRVDVASIVTKQLEAMSKPIRFRLTMTDGTSEWKEWELTTTTGKPAIISDITTQPFAKDCRFDPPGKTVITTGQINAGLVVSATPIQEREDETSVKIDMNYVYLKNMVRQNTQGGCSVELPHTDGQNLDGYVVRLREGQKVELPSGARDRYHFSIQRI